MVPSFSMERQQYFHRFKKSNYLKISKLIYTLYKEIIINCKEKKMFRYKYFTILFYYSLTYKKYNRKE